MSVHLRDMVQIIQAFEVEYTNEIQSSSKEPIVNFEVDKFQKG